jgi:hypothetical protein
MTPPTVDDSIQGYYPRCSDSVQVAMIYGIYAWGNLEAKEHLPTTGDYGRGRERRPAVSRTAPWPLVWLLMQCAPTVTPRRRLLSPCSAPILEAMRWRSLRQNSDQSPGPDSIGSHQLDRRGRCGFWLRRWAMSCCVGASAAWPGRAQPAISRTTAGLSGCTRSISLALDNPQENVQFAVASVNAEGAVPIAPAVV